MLISACMIVKNESEMLKKTLPLLVKHMDEVIVVDTGSSDDTKIVAQDSGAQVFDFAWISDFSAARNFSISKAQGEWILWIDADEIIKEENFIRLKEFLKNASGTAYNLLICESAVDKYVVENSYKRVKIFKNGLNIHFERKINEQVCDAHGKFIPAEDLNIPVFHWGNRLSPEKMAQKKQRNIEMFGKMLKDNPDDPYAHYLIGQSYIAISDYARALEHYESALKLMPRDRQLFLNVVEQKIQALYKMNRGKEAYIEALNLRKIDPENIKALNILGAVLLSGGSQLDLAETVLKSVDSIEGKLSETYEKRYLNKMLLGDLLKRKNNFKEALAAYKTAQEYIDSEEIRKRIEVLQNER